MAPDLIHMMAFRASVRKRPFMYIGNNGLTHIFYDLISELFRIAGTDQMFIEITIHKDNEFSLEITSDHDTVEMWGSFYFGSDDKYILYPRVLKALSSKFEISALSSVKSELKFSIDPAVFEEIKVNNNYLVNLMLQLAVLNRGSRILVRDNRTEVPSVNYFHAPEGIFRLLENARASISGPVCFYTKIDEVVEGISYQIGFYYFRNWYPPAEVCCFANDEHNRCGGSLKDGVIDGLRRATRFYIRERGLNNLKFRSQMLMRGLVLCCSVRGRDFQFGGSFKETLEDKDVRKTAARLVEKSVKEFLQKHPEIASDFLRRF